MIERGGWHLPSGDTYFARFVEGKPPKRNGFMREHLLAAFKHVRAWNIAVDCGAHVGFWCADMAQRFETVYAFEAFGPTYECLLKNVEEYGNVKAFNLAVGEKAGTCSTRNDNARPGNTGSFFVIPGAGEVQMVALDEMDIPGCDLLKVDVEGYELRVLQGARKLIKRHRPVISIECTDEKFRGRYKDIPVGEAQRWLAMHKYRQVAHMRPDKVFVSNAP